MKLKSLLLSIGLLCTSVGLACPIHKIVVFGDSLSDNGNFYKFMDEQSPPPPYFKGRFSNGPVWAEALAQHYFPTDTAMHVENYAMGLAAVSSDRTQESPLFTLDGQIETYINDHKDGSSVEDSLFIFWIGSNNYLGLPDDEGHTLTTEVTSGIRKNVELLIEKGAKHFLILNLPDIGKTPYARNEDLYKKCPDTHKTCASDALSAFSKEHNDLLYKDLFDSKEGLKAKYPKVNWLFFNINRMFSDVIQKPGYYGLDNVSEPCLKPAINSENEFSVMNMISSYQPAPSPVCKGYLFVDFLHPTTYAHNQIAEKVINLLEDSGVDIS